jgi:hypothetical protein
VRGTGTRYEAIFEFLQNREQLRFTHSTAEFAMIEEGDVGRLIYQGTRFLGFENDCQRASLGERRGVSPPWQHNHGRLTPRRSPG